MGEWGRRGEGREGHGKEKGRHPEGAGRDAVLAMFWLLEDAEEPVHEERGHRRAHKWREAWNGEAVLPVVVGLVLDGVRLTFLDLIESVSNFS